MCVCVCVCVREREREREKMYESLVAGLHNMIRQLAATFDFDKDIIKTGVNSTRDDQQMNIHTLTQHTLVNTNEQTHTYTSLI